MKFLQDEKATRKVYMIAQRGQEGQQQTADVNVHIHAQK